VEPVAVLLESEKQVAGRDPGVFPHIEKKHAVCDDGLHDTDKQVRMDVDLHINKVISLMVPRWEGKEIKFFLFHD